MNVLAFSCPHLPYEHKDSIPFLQRVGKAYKCTEVVCLGDIVDNHSISYHEHDPNLWSPADEMAKVDKKLQAWFKAFPKLTLCRGNHDMLVDRKGKTHGLPKRAFKQFREIWNLPKGWKDVWSTEIDGVKYEHGTGYSGKYGHVQAAYDNRQSTVIGHLHATCGIEYIGNNKNQIFGMAAGCLIDRKSMAYAYGRNFKRKPIIACCVITDNGRNARPVVMR